MLRAAKNAPATSAIFHFARGFDGFGKTGSPRELN